MTLALTFRVKVIGQRSPGKKKRYFRSHLTTLQVTFDVKGHMGEY